MKRRCGEKRGMAEKNPRCRNPVTIKATKLEAVAAVWKGENSAGTKIVFQPGCPT